MYFLLGTILSRLSIIFSPSPSFSSGAASTTIDGAFDGAFFLTTSMTLPPTLEEEFAPLPIF